MFFFNRFFCLSQISTVRCQDGAEGYVVNAGEVRPWSPPAMSAAARLGFPTQWRSPRSMLQSAMAEEKWLAKQIWKSMKLPDFEE